MELRLFPKQTEFFDKVLDDKVRLQDNALTEFYYFGGFGSGKSRITMSINHLLCLKYPVHAVIIRQTYPELSDSTIPQFNSYFNFEGYVFNKANRVAEYASGARLDFRAFGDEPAKILSNEYDLITFSQLEEINEELFLQAKGRNRRRIGGLPKNIFLGEGNPSSGWVKRYLKDNKLPPHVWLTEATTFDNPYLPREYVKNMTDTYPKHWIRRYIYGEWSAQGDEVFDEFRESYIIEAIPHKFIKGFKQRAGLDYGWVNPTAVVWGFVDYDGKLTIFDEWGDTKQSCAQIAKEAHRYGKVVIVGDYSMKRPDKDGRSVWHDMERAGMNLMESNKQEIENIQLTNTLFKTGRLLITKNCVNLLREIRDYKFKKLRLGEERNQYEETIDKDNHYIDAMLYLIASLEELKTPDPKIGKEKDTIREKVMEYPEKDWSEMG